MIRLDSPYEVGEKVDRASLRCAHPPLAPRYLQEGPENLRKEHKGEGQNGKYKESIGEREESRARVFEFGVEMCNNMSALLYKAEYLGHHSHYIL